MSEIREEKLDFWIKHSYNVLFVGPHGIGKTAVVMDAFNRAGLSCRMYSAATMDPWVDFIGVPKEQKSDNGEVFLDLVRPKGLDDVEAIFFDEFNRSPKKVRNAVMELIQFKSINGKKFPKLRIIWAAINPKDDGEYDVEDLDPAQEDRFHIKVKMPVEPNLAYFSQKYGDANARAAISWWKDLPQAERPNVSPRRLDYALDVHANKGDLRDVLPASTNISKLISTLKNGPLQAYVERLLDVKDVDEAKKFLADNNNYNACIDWICGNPKRQDFFLPLISEEQLAALVVQRKRVLKHVVESAVICPPYLNVLKSIIAAKQNDKIVRYINSSKDNTLKKALYPPPPKVKTPAVASAEEVSVDEAIGNWKGKGKPTVQPFAAIESASYMQLLYDLQKANTTYQRKDISARFGHLLKQAFYTTPAEAHDVLVFMEELALRSHSATLLDTVFPEEVKRAIDLIAARSGSNRYDYCMTHLASIYPWIKRRIDQNSKLAKKIL